MLPTHDDIVAITQSVMATVLELNPEECASLPGEPRADRVTGCIQISGQWKGAVVLETTTEFATLAAARMLAIDEQKVTDADQQDAIAELTNMVGGNIKSQVPGPSFLSLPSVTTGLDFDIRLYRAVCVDNVPLRFEDLPIRIVMCESLEQGD